MSRTVRSAALETRTARLKLAEGRKHWQPIDQGLHVGYRRGPRGGSWYARRFTEASYVEKVLGVADDRADADGLSVLGYRAAIEEARRWRQQVERQALGLGETPVNAYTVADACDDYLRHYVAKGGKAENATRTTIEVHIRPSLGSVELLRLATRRIRDWHIALAEAPKRVRTGKAAVRQATRDVDRADPDAVRSRRATANRVLTVLKAALNHAWHERHVASDDAWRSVKPFKAVDAATVRYLTPDECRRLVNACQGALRDLVRGALYTGARYGELCRLQVRDVDLVNGTALVREAKAGQPRHIVLTDEGVELLSGLVSGRSGLERVFVRDDGAGWKAAQATRPILEACRRAAISPAASFHVLRHTYASTLAMKGVAMGVIAAQLGHADTRVTEKHYAHLAPSYVAHTIRANFPELGLNEPSTVRPLRLVGSQ